jgi:hypothetical protein
MQLRSDANFDPQIHRHHKRTVYASNSFPVESYGWDCNDEGLFYYGQPMTGKKSTPAYWQGHISPTNPFIPSGFLGSCQFPQITAEGLDDSWQHGRDLYGVYHDLLHFLPPQANDEVTFRVTQNVITSEVAGMAISGMFGTEAHYPLLVEVDLAITSRYEEANKYLGQGSRLFRACVQLPHLVQPLF